MKNESKVNDRLSVRDLRGDLSSNDAASWTQLATALMKNEKYQEAIDMLYVAIQCDPGAGRAWFALGLAYQKLGRLTDAREALQIARANGVATVQVDPYLKRLNEAIKAQKAEADRLNAALGGEVSIAEADQGRRALLSEWGKTA